MWEIITAIATNPATLALGALVSRNVYGWLVNSMKDGAIQDYEWRELGKTLFTLGGMTVFAYMGINAVWSVTPEQTAAVVAFVDVLRSQFKK